ncbi:dehydrogenase/reductase SDR family member 7-like [Convolutriloba macropyga]|uniref:dehydrogenase/reductase SDR family member 7-like n=1 Tax=Convolutriloba macropyga TaxID=536237 RepID=UPI003F525AD8
MGKFVISYRMLNFASLALAGLLLFTAPVLAILLIVFMIVGAVFMDSDVSLRILEKFGTKPEDSFLKNSVVWITGASSGLGEELAYRLSKISGISLVLSSRKEKELERVAENCKALGCSKVLVLPMDIAEYNMHEKCLQKVVEEFGKVDVLVNNAGVYQQGFVLDCDFPVLKRTIEVDFLGQISLTRLVAKHMKDTNTKGFITFVSSIASLGVPFTATYSAAKAALNCFAYAVANEWLECGIDVQVVRLGPVITQIGENSLMRAENQVGGSSSAHHFNTEYNPMTAKRSIELMAIAMANKLPEAWIANKLCFLCMYAYEYLPTTTRWIFGKPFLQVYKKADEATKK